MCWGLVEGWPMQLREGETHFSASGQHRWPPTMVGGGLLAPGNWARTGRLSLAVWKSLASVRNPTISSSHDSERYRSTVTQLLNSTLDFWKWLLRLSSTCAGSRGTVMKIFWQYLSAPPFYAHGLWHKACDTLSSKSNCKNSYKIDFITEL